MSRQLAWLVRTHTWPDATTGPLARRVYVIVGANDPALTDAACPFVCIHADGKEPDDQQPELGYAVFSVIIVQAAEGQDMTQAALLGGARTGGLGESEGRGALEIEEEVEKAVGFLTGADGCRATVGAASAPSAQQAQGRIVVATEIPVRAAITTRRHYECPSYLVATGGSGSVALSWANAPTRWDQYDENGTRLAPIVRYATGATAPADATSGTGVSGISAGDTSKSVSLAAGTYSFAIFQPYTETGVSTPERYSAQETGTTRLSVVVS